MKRILLYWLLSFFLINTGLALISTMDSVYLANYQGDNVFEAFFGLIQYHVLWIIPYWWIWIFLGSFAGTVLAIILDLIMNSNLRHFVRRMGKGKK